MNDINKIVKLDSVGQGLLRNDANLIGYFELQLQQVLTKTYDVIYPNLKGTQVIPVDTSINEGARTFAFYSYDKVGMAKIIADYGDDLPAVDVIGQKNVREIKLLGDSFSYGIEDIAAAQFAGEPMEQRKANAAKLGIEQKINQIAWLGDPEYNLYGFLNHPNVPVGDVPNDGTGGTTEWVNKTPEQILRDMNEACREIITNTKAVYSADTLLLPVKQYDYIQNLIYNPINGRSVLDVFKGNRPGVTVDWVNELEGAGTAGKDVMIAYVQNPDTLGLYIPVPFTTIPPQAVNLMIKIPCYAKCGGVVIYYPLSANIKEGI